MRQCGFCLTCLGACYFLLLYLLQGPACRGSLILYLLQNSVQRKAGQQLREGVALNEICCRRSIVINKINSPDQNTIELELPKRTNLLDRDRRIPRKVGTKIPPKPTLKGYFESDYKTEYISICTNMLSVSVFIMKQ